jgi:hypothetical protein
MTQLTIDLYEADEAMIRARAAAAIADDEHYYQGNIEYAIECEWRYFEDELSFSGVDQ